MMEGATFAIGAHYSVGSPLPLAQREPGHGEQRGGPQDGRRRALPLPVTGALPGGPVAPAHRLC